MSIQISIDVLVELCISSINGDHYSLWPLLSSTSNLKRTKGNREERKALIGIMDLLWGGASRQHLLWLIDLELASLPI
jgi:hypothetical protein